MTPKTLRPTLVAAAVTVALCLGSMSNIEAQEPLTLRINDAEARPGKVFALVIRTYASRQLGQGQVGAHASQSLHQGEGAGADDLLSLPIRSVVFSDEGDAVSRLEVDTTGTGLTLRFRSPTATVNKSDGPMAVLYFRMPQTAPPGVRFDVIVDPLESFLVDHLGEPVEIAAAAGRVRVLEPGDRFSVSAGAEDTVVGEPAILSMQTAQVERLSAGQAAFRFKPSLFDGPPVVSIDPRYGNATWIVDDSTPGLVIVTFESSDGSLNFVPGDIVTVTLPSRADIPPGTSTPIRLDRDLTWLTKENGDDLALSIESGLLVFQ